jgi:soluble lytic murein transglycosylase-like protein
MAPNLENWPSDWGKPSKEMMAVIAEAAEKFEVPEDLIYGIIRKESNFNPKLRGYKHGGNSKTFAESYEKYKNKVIPGKNPKSVTWGEVFKKPEDWCPYGLMQTLPYHVYGKTGGVPIGSPIKDLFKVAPNVRCAVAYLTALAKKYPGSWGKVLKVYNGKTSYAIQVASYISQYNEARGLM